MYSPWLSKWVRKAAQTCQDLSVKLGVDAGLLTFKSRPGDIFVASYPRSGTTWLQMILYQLTTAGELDFVHITHPIPYLERALSAGRDLERMPSPRVFKTHLRYRRVPKGPSKKIYVARNGKDVLVSCYHFFLTHSGFRGTMEEFFMPFMTGNIPSGSWFRHVAEWSAHAADPDVLFLRYEDLVNDFGRTLDRIIAFLQLSITPEHRARVVERSSFQFMKQYEDKFGFFQEVMLEMGFTGAGFIRQGKVGSGADALTPAQHAVFEQAASLVIMPAPAETPRHAARA